jgi:hypothetical protein
MPLPEASTDGDQGYDGPIGQPAYGGVAPPVDAGSDDPSEGGTADSGMVGQPVYGAPAYGAFPPDAAGGGAPGH